MNNKSKRLPRAHITKGERATRTIHSPLIHHAARGPRLPKSR